MKISVIVPMYNVQEYVASCLDSLCAQTLSDMEVILVDDGCTDDTARIAQEYADRNPERFHLVHKVNGGLSDARNEGLKYARGEYIAFLDSDDFVEPSLYEKLLRVIEADDADVAVTDIEYWYEDASRCYTMKGLSDRTADDIHKRAMLSPMFAWNKLYRSSFFKDKGLRYPLHTWYEDIPVTAMIFATSRRIACLDECLIHYRQRAGSIMANRSDPRLQDIFPIMAELREEFDRAGLTERYHEELEYLHIEHLCLYGMFRFIRSDHWPQYYQRSREVMKACYPDWQHNRYIRDLGFRNRVFLRCYNRGTAWLFHALIR